MVVYADNSMSGASAFGAASSSSASSAPPIPPMPYSGSGASNNSGGSTNINDGRISNGSTGAGSEVGTGGGGTGEGTTREGEVSTGGDYRKWDPNKCSHPVTPTDLTPPSELREALDRGDASPLLTLIFTTSPVPCNPDTYFIEHTVGSYATREPCLARCRKIIVCDGFLLRQEGKPCDFRRGRVNASAREHYDEYVRRLHGLCDEARKYGDPSNVMFNAEVLALDRRHGFAHAVRRALLMVSTPFVMVVQHDRVAVRPFGCVALMRSLLEWGKRHVNYVCLGTSSTWNNAMRGMTEFKFDPRDYCIDVIETSHERDRKNKDDDDSCNNDDDASKLKKLSEFLLVPMVFWYDSTHICRTEFYRDFAFREHYRGNDAWRMKAGEFIEDKLGQVLRSQVTTGGVPAHLRFGTYLLTHRFDMSLNYPVSKVGINPPKFYQRAFGELPAVQPRAPKAVCDMHVVVTHLNQRKLMSLHRRTGGEAASHPFVGAAVSAAAQAVKELESWPPPSAEGRINFKST